MNETECESLIKSVKWTEPSSLISLAILEFINVLVIGGNCLVIAAVFCSNKLRSVTNFFIVNLAVADLLVGLAVLPFSATWEVFKVWIFGDVWCRIWLAVDVWMCTASILNLCAISLDRYVAVTRPVTYPSIMSTKKAKSLIAGIWVLSFVICFPPLVGWKDQKPEIKSTYIRGNYTLYYATTTTRTSAEMAQMTTTTKSMASSSNIYTLESLKEQEKQQNNKIALSLSNNNNNISNNRIAYNPYDPYTYSSLDFEADADDEASVTLFTTSSTNFTTQSTKSTTIENENNNKNDSNNDDVTSITKIGPPPSCPWKCELTNDRGYVLYSALGSFYIPMFVMLFFYWRIYRAAVRTTRAINQGFKTTKGSSPKDVGSGSSNRVDESQIILRIHRGRPSNTTRQNPLSTHSMSSALSVNSNSEDALPLHHCGGSLTFAPKRTASMRISRQRPEKVSIKVSFPSSENVLDTNCSMTSSPPPYGLVTATTSSSLNKSSLSNGRRTSFKSSLFEIGETAFNLDNSTVESGSSAGVNSGDGGGGGGGSGDGGSESTAHTPKDSKKRSGKRAHKFQVKRFRMETKAAKTLAIIVGGFIVCWLPFFTMYLIRAFCEQCIQPTVFSVLFWLGYCNSAINPLIYALFSHEFRVAFKRILFRCVCTRSGFRASENFQMIAARALMAPATFHKTISGCSDDGDGPDFS